MAANWTRLIRITVWAAACCLAFVRGVSGEILPNGGFESGRSGWQSFWSRDQDVGSAELDRGIVVEGAQSLRVRHRGARDWCVNSEVVLPVKAGDLLVLEGWAKIDGPGSVTLAVETRGEEDRVIEWIHAGRTVDATRDWTRLRARFLVPDGVQAVRPRWVGTGPSTVWLDNVSFRHEGSHASLNVPLPEPLSIRNRWLTLTLRTAGGEMSVTDRRTGRRWEQQSGGPGLIALSASAGERLELVLLDVGSGLRITNRWMLEAEAPEIVTTLETEGELSDPVRFPYPFVTEAGTRLVVPLNEGIAYPVEDPTVETMRLIAYGGHGLCMAFWGVTDGEAGHMAILETPDDAAIRLRRRDGLLAVQPEWESQRGRWGYRRSLRYVFFDAGGHVAMAKRYRGYAKSIGRFKTLAEKRAENPNVDLLAGAANIWCWDRDAVSIVREMQAAGMDRILWSNRQEPEALDQLNELGVLTSRYDIYQDVMAPTNFPHLRGVHPDWVTEAWPRDVIRDARGRSLPGWEVRGTNGQWYPCGVVCDRRIPSYAASRIPPELLTHPYRCRFIDTTTASPWRECYDPAHPMTRSESREWKMRLLATVCQELRLVTGCETGHDAAVPWVHYFEGMLSLGPYRVPDSGRDMQRIWTEVPDRVARFQLGHTYRLPLWELVYHDCVVAQWYWGDYNNKLPGLWEKRDLFNALYGTPPMYMLDRSRWTREKQRFVRSYLRATPVARATAYAEMTGHQYLTVDRAVQQTTFANGVRVTVNFGEQPFRSSDVGEIPAAGLRVERMPVNQEPAGSQPGSGPPR